MISNSIFSSAQGIKWGIAELQNDFSKSGRYILYNQFSTDFIQSLGYNLQLLLTNSLRAVQNYHDEWNVGESLEKTFMDTWEVCISDIYGLCYLGKSGKWYD